MKHIHRAIALGSLAAVAVMATADEIVLKKGMDIDLKLAENIDSRKLNEHDTIMFKMAQNVYVDGKLIFRAGQPVVAVIDEMSPRGRYGKNAQILLEFQPVKTVSGDYVMLQERRGGQSWKGSRTDRAAIATGAGALVLGPVGLLGGLFVHGKPVVMKAGAEFDTTVARTTVIDM